MGGPGSRLASCSPAAGVLSGVDEVPCAGKGFLFFDRDRDSVAAAKAICATCPHQEPCLAKAMATPFTFHDGCGVWAGTDPEERRAMRRAAYRAAG